MWASELSGHLWVYLSAHLSRLAPAVGEELGTLFPVQPTLCWAGKQAEG